ncbi:signal peptidase I [Bacillus sp. MUM 13]|uniref:signal peptidase I SipW n=1 Tax=Bacillus sp. MUM 13 TaxID=1678001 RepID=UPI0008F55B30|nr:signal peptidase I [Bacillus sp. MUM 13]OIK11412.1 signal peptidase I [Bacillus sp. MUM 13]
MKKLIKFLSNALTFVLAALLILMAFFVVSSKASGGTPQAFGYQLKSVLSGSMEPTFLTGSVIAVKPLKAAEKTQLKKGDIITFQAGEDKTITHRIQKVIKSGANVSYQTKGDNNNAADLEPVLSANVVDKYNGFTIPYAGYFMNYASSKTGSALLMIIPGLLLLAYAAVSILKALKEIDPKKNEDKTKTA